MLAADVFIAMEIDIIHEAKRSGVHNFSSLLFEYHIISQSDLDLVGWLSEYLPAENLSLILVELLANNVKNPSKYKMLINFLGNVSSLHHLYQKVEVLLG